MPRPVGAEQESHPQQESTKESPLAGALTALKRIVEDLKGNRDSSTSDTKPTKPSASSARPKHSTG